MIEEKLYNKYGMTSFSSYESEYVDNEAFLILHYQEFLRRTDYIDIKIGVGKATVEEYLEEDKARDFARSEINRLQKEQQLKFQNCDKELIKY